ncbi:hypothetical protein OUZ56_005986 [Daphnia magna]|uniref:Uncharacterized protein n=1 Tax=Daphnia magna TaxID=35525 RepID=A0ABQ9YUB9_9CRUS|nr:hypothetical protein OUZ56_005986 [Daphnia magna]
MEKLDSVRFLIREGDWMVKVEDAHIRNVPSTRLMLPSKSLVTSVHDTPYPLLQSGALKLAAWKLSGDPTACKGFRRQLWLSLLDKRPKTHRWKWTIL